VGVGGSRMEGGSWKVEEVEVGRWEVEGGR
jgi:hypothetical protein